MTLALRVAALGFAAFVLAACAGKVAGGDPDGGGAGGSGSSSGASTDTCAEACANILRLPCQQPTQTQCESSCNDGQATAQMDGCGDEFAALLACVDQGSLRCSAGQVDTSGCRGQTTALAKCEHPPPAGCEAIPYPSATVGCSGFGGGSGGVYTNSCTDGMGNTWAAKCTGSTCACSYDGAMACTCVTDGGAGASCCPGT